MTRELKLFELAVVFRESNRFAKDFNRGIYRREPSPSKVRLFYEVATYPASASARQRLVDFCQSSRRPASPLARYYRDYAADERVVTFVGAAEAEA